MRIAVPLLNHVNSTAGSPGYFFHRGLAVVLGLKRRRVDSLRFAENSRNQLLRRYLGFERRVPVKNRLHGGKLLPQTRAFAWSGGNIEINILPYPGTPNGFTQSPMILGYPHHGSAFGNRKIGNAMLDPFGFKLNRKRAF